MKSIRKLFSTSAFRVVLIVVIVVFPINILTLALSQTTIEEVERKISLQVQGALDLYMTQIDGAIERITMKMHYITINDVDFARLNVKEIKDKEEYYNQLQSVVNLKNTMADIIDDNGWVTGVFTYFPDKDVQIVNSRYTTYNSNLMGYVEDIAKDNNKENVKKWRIANIEGADIIIFVSNYKKAYYGAWFDIKSLANTLNINGESNELIFAFTDRDSNICYSNQEEFRQYNMDEIQQDLRSKDRLIIEAESKYSDLSLIQILSKSEIKNNLPYMIKILQIASMLALLILPIIILSLKKWMLNPLRKLTQAMRRIEKGDMDFRIEEQKIGSEFEQIYKNFNHMMDEVTTLKINVYEEQLEKQQIKMRFLSQQITPHFILNAMNIVYSYEQDEYPLIQKMILCISKYFRYIVNANSDFVELWKEIEHIHNYFEIQEARYPETFYATVECEEDLYPCLIPPLLIQNFAENAIKHSLKIGNQIEIRVVAKRHNKDFLKIILTDTGEGISDQVLEQIHNFRETRIYQEGLGVGIQNSIERLEIFYSGNANLEILREKPQGTRVEIILPIHLGLEE